jgi:hypothetical protein
LIQTQSNLTHTKEMANINFLRIPLYKLYYIDNVYDYVIDDQFIKAYSKAYSEQERGSILEALEWASVNADYDFKSLLPDIKFTNEEIYFYLTYLLRFIQEAE